MKRIIIDNDMSDQRLDRLLKKILHKATRGYIYKAIRTRKVTVNGKKAHIDTQIQVGDILCIYVPEYLYIQSKKMPFREVSQNFMKRLFHILYEDDDIIVLNKPSGISVHSGKKDKKSINLTDCLWTYLHGKVSFEIYRPSFVHRLDKYTSGVLVAAKTATAARYYTKIFREHAVRKYYQALVKGIMKGKKYERYNIEYSLEKYDHKKGRVKISSDGKSSLTTYEIEKIFHSMTLVYVQIFTGRMHQIRVHFASIGHPLVGDDVYGDKKWNAVMRKKYGMKRLFLHAHKLELSDMQGEERVFQAPLADDLSKQLKMRDAKF